MMLLDKPIPRVVQATGLSTVYRICKEQREGDTSTPKKEEEKRGVDQ